MKLILEPNKGQGFKRAFKVAKKLANRENCIVVLAFNALGREFHEVEPHVGRADRFPKCRSAAHGDFRRHDWLPNGKCRRCGKERNMNARQERQVTALPTTEGHFLVPVIPREGE